MGAKFLFGKDEIAGISKNSIMFEIDNVKTTATIWSESECRDKVENPNFTNFLDVGCKSCGNTNGQNLKIHYSMCKFSSNIEAERHGEHFGSQIFIW